MRFLKIGIALFTFSLSLPDLHAGGYKISKSDEVFDDLAEIKLSTKYARKKPITSWARDVKQIIPVDPTSSQRYKVVINLKDFTGPFLPHISSFLTALGEDQEVNSKTPVVLITNGTSFKFNRIFSGIETYFENTPSAQVVYFQGGIQRPLAAIRGLTTLSPIKTLSEAASSADGLQDEFCHYSAVTEELGAQFKGLVHQKPLVSPSEPTKPIEPGTTLPTSPTFSEISTEGEQTYETKSPEAALQIAIACGERQAQEDTLMQQWEDHGGGMWPPLGVNRKEQILTLGPDELEDDFLVLPSAPRVLRVSGLFPGDFQKVIALCKTHPQLRALIIEYSSCDPNDFKELHCSAEPSEEDPDLLGNSKIRFVDVRSAFNQEDDISDVGTYYKRHGQESSLLYFIRFPFFSNGLPAFEELTAEEKQTHVLYHLFYSYLRVLNAKSESLS